MKKKTHCYRHRSTSAHTFGPRPSPSQAKLYGQRGEFERHHSHIHVQRSGSDPKHRVMTVKPLGRSSLACCGPEDPVAVPANEGELVDVMSDNQYRGQERVWSSAPKAAHGGGGNSSGIAHAKRDSPRKRAREAEFNPFFMNWET